MDSICVFVCVLACVIGGCRALDEVPNSTDVTSTSSTSSSKKSTSTTTPNTTTEADQDVRISNIPKLWSEIFLYAFLSSVIIHFIAAVVAFHRLGNSAGVVGKLFALLIFVNGFISPFLCSAITTLFFAMFIAKAYVIGVYEYTDQKVPIGPGDFAFGIIGLGITVILTFFSFMRFVTTL